MEGNIDSKELKLEKSIFYFRLLQNEMQKPNWTN